MSVSTNAYQKMYRKTVREREWGEDRVRWIKEKESEREREKSDREREKEKGRDREREKRR